jgi:beta-N-acetylhexosaminidase
MHPTLDLTSLDTKIGRLFMAGIPGIDLDDGTQSLIRDWCLGGVVLFSRNIEDPVQVAKLCNDLQRSAIRHHGIPLFIAVDQEGGRVARLKPPFTIFPGNAAIGRSESPEASAMEFARVTAKEMGLAGLNMNLAPVLDVRRGEPEKHLAGRTFSDDPEKVADLGRTVVEGLQENGVMAVAKHFPGLGKAAVDPHHELPTIDIDLGEMKSVNLLPFRAAMDAGVSGVMTSHAVYPAIDPEVPATLSRKILTELLREEMGFQGLVITDDLEMGAIAKRWGVPGGASAAFAAGADILLVCEGQDLVLESMRTLRDELIKGRLSFQRLYLSLERIAEAKARFLAKAKRASMERVRAHLAS